MASRCILLIATLPERAAYFREAIDSASRCADLLDAVCLSVNGDSAAQAATIYADYPAFSKLPLHILCTGHRISAIQHSLFILKQICTTVSPTDILLLLGDDDLLAPSERLEPYIAKLKKGDGRMVGVGRFYTFTNDPLLANGECHSLEPGESTSPLTYLARHSKLERFTNISGMLVPFSIYADALRFMARFGSSGRRTEHIVYSHRRVRELYSPEKATALIRRHQLQEGVALSYRSYFYDELVFMLWVWMHQPQTRPWRNGGLYGFSLRRFLVFLRGYVDRTAPIQALVKLKHWIAPP
jgi:hypothetical protein